MNRSTRGWLNGLAGVIIFSGSLPATRVAVTAFDAMFLTAMRATIAGVLALMLLLVLRAPRPSRTDIGSLLLVAVGVVVGFPLLTALALQQVTSAHSIVFIGLLPLATASFGAMRGGERPPAAFWAFSALGSALIVGFVVAGGFSASLRGDGLMLASIIVCGYGYAEGGRLARTLGGWQVICWALVLALPVMIALAAVTWPPTLAGIAAGAWAGLAYVSLFSMLIGFIFWYRGLAEGGIAAVGQLQLLQPFCGLALAALLLGEVVEPRMIVVCAGVALCVAGAKRSARATPARQAPG